MLAEAAWALYKKTPSRESRGDLPGDRYIICASIFKFLTEKARETRNWHEFTQAICTMASFYYSYQNLSEVRFLVQIRAFCYLNLNELARFKYERKNEMNQVWV